MLSLFGTAISNYGILRGKLEVGQAIPITKETEGITGIKSEVSIFQILNKVPHTHMDDSKQRDKIDKAKEKSEVQMRYYDEVMIPGTQLYHYFVLRDCSELEKSCFWTAINEFNKYPRLGGNSRIGMGKVRWDYEIGDTKLYEDYLKENKKEIFKVFKMIYSKFKPILKRDAKFKEAVEKSIKNKE